MIDLERESKSNKMNEPHMRRRYRGSANEMDKQE